MPEVKKRSRKRHYNSKLGCSSCKKRRIKCGEELDSCYNCIDRNLRCSFLDLNDEEKQKIIDSNLVRKEKEQQLAKEMEEGVIQDSDISAPNNGSFIMAVKPFKSTGVIDFGAPNRTGSQSGSLGTSSKKMSHHSSGENEKGKVKKDETLKDSYIKSEQKADFEEKIGKFSVSGIAELSKKEITKLHKDTEGLLTSNRDQKPFKIQKFNPKNWGAESQEKVSHDKIKLQNDFLYKNVQPYTIENFLNSIYHKQNIPINFVPIIKNPDRPVNLVQKDTAQNGRSNNEKSIGNPLPNATKLNNQKFNLYLVLKGCMRTTLENEYENFWPCGDDSDQYGKFNLLMHQWYFATGAKSTYDILIFNGFISHGGYIAYNQACKSYSGIGPKSREVILKIAQQNREMSDWRFQKCVERLNMPQYLNTKEYVTLVSSSISFASINLALSMIADSNYANVLYYMEMFISMSLSKQLVDTFNIRLDKIRSEDRSFHDDHLLFRALLRMIQVFHHVNMNALFMTNYGLDLFKELIEDFNDTRSMINDNIQFFKSNLSDKSYKILNQIDELNDFLNDLDFNKINYRNNFVCGTDVVYIYSQMKRFLCLIPSHFCFPSSTFQSLDIYQRFLMIYWMAFASVLDILFSESVYIFMSRFEGVILFMGYRVNYYESILKELTASCKHSNPVLYEKIYRKTIYLSRVISFTKYRWRTFLRNLKAYENYPSKRSSDEDLLKSRKITILKEKQVRSLKRSAVAKENYISLDRNKAGKPIVESPDGEFYQDGDFLFSWEDAESSADENIDKDFKYEEIKRYLSENEFNIDTFPIEYMKLSKFGLLYNVDYRPRLSNSSSLMDIAPNFYDDKLKDLSFYVSDRYKILSANKDVTSLHQATAKID